MLAVVSVAHISKDFFKPPQPRSSEGKKEPNRAGALWALGILCALFGGLSTAFVKRDRFFAFSERELLGCIIVCLSIYLRWCARVTKAGRSCNSFPLVSGGRSVFWVRSSPSIR